MISLALYDAICKLWREEKRGTSWPFIYLWFSFFVCIVYRFIFATRQNFRTSEYSL